MTHSLRAREKALEKALDELVEWYASASNGKFPESICEDKKSYRGKVMRWIEPILPHQVNPVLVEEYIGDMWSLRFEPYENPITNLRK